MRHILSFCSSPIFFLCVVGFLSYLSVYLLGPFVIAWLKKQNHLDQIQKAYCEKLESLHQSKKHTPTAGGVLFTIVLLTSVLVCFPWKNLSTWLFAFLIMGWSGLGWYDDIVKKRRKRGHGITAKQKFIVQLVLALITTIFVFYFHRDSEQFHSLRVPFMGIVCLDNSYLSSLICWGLSILAIVGTSNAVNLTDGLDGLASGITCMSSIGLLVVSLLSRDMALSGEVSVILATLIGVSAAFLKFNLPPAQVFMGDTGSLLIGGILGSCAVMIRAELLLIILGGVFVVEASSVILQVASYRLRGKRIFLCAPLHHHYEYKGMSERNIVRCFWFAGWLLMILGIIAAIK